MTLRCLRARLDLDLATVSLQLHLNWTHRKNLKEGLAINEGRDQLGEG